MRFGFILGILLRSGIISSDLNFFSLFLFCALVVGDFFKAYSFFVQIDDCFIVPLSNYRMQLLNEAVSINLSLFITTNSGWFEFLCNFLQKPNACEYTFYGVFGIYFPSELSCFVSAWVAWNNWAAIEAYGVNSQKPKTARHTIKCSAEQHAKRRYEEVPKQRQNCKNSRMPCPMVNKNHKLPDELIVKANCKYPWTITWTSAITQCQVLL